MKPYNITIFDAEYNSNSRFILGTSGEKPLIVLGLNPSRADKDKSDRTISKVMGFAEKAKPEFDSFIMLNLYPQREQNPTKLHSTLDPTLHELNKQCIFKTVSQIKNPSILAAWGETIKINSFFINCLKEIYDGTKPFNVKWLKIGQPTKSGHPRHPSRAPYTDLSYFEIQDYIYRISIRE